jgi:HK97 family phage prohead protease
MGSLGAVAGAATVDANAGAAGRSGGSRMTRELVTGAAHDAELVVRSEDERLIDLRVVPWDVVGRTREGAERIKRGAFRGTNAADVTLEAIGPHGAEPGVTLAGRGVSFTEGDDGAIATFRVSRTRAGDELLELARDGVYRAASAVFEPLRSRRAPDGVIERELARLVRVGIVERGAYPGAEILAVRSEGEMTETLEPLAPIVPGVRIEATGPDMAERLDDLRRDMLGRMTALEARSGAAAPANSPLARWGSLGAYIVDASADPDAAVLLARALVDQTTVDNPGVIPPAYVADVKGIIAAVRPAVDAFGGPASLGESGMTLTWPLYAGDLTTLVAKQAAEKTEIHSVKVSITEGSEPIATYAGGSDISWQLLKRSRPAYAEAYGRIMLAGWALTTEADFEAALLAGATGTIVFVPSTATDAQIRAAFFAASAKVKTATGRPATAALADSATFGRLGGILTPPAYGTANQTGTAQASTLSVNVSGLEVTEAPFFPPDTMLFGNSAAAQWHEDGPMVATAEDVARLGQNRAIWSMGAAGIFLPAGLVVSAATAGLSAESAGNGGNGGTRRGTK